MSVTEPWVAEIPIRCSGPPARASSRSRDKARWAPRLLPARAWISSRMSVRTVPSSSRPEAEVSRI